MPQCTPTQHNNKGEKKKASMVKSNNILYVYITNVLSVEKSWGVDSIFFPL
jgi:hypothetical protein